MKRTIISSLALLAVATASPAAAMEPSPPPRLADRDWVVRSVSPSGRVLLLQTLGAPCGHDPRATVTETPTAVAIRVQEIAPDISAIRCIGPGSDVLRVRLAAPIGGRDLIGQSLRSDPSAAGGVPRMIGLRAADARFALRAQGFRVAGDRIGRVVAQRPRAHADGRTVTLTTALLCGGAPWPA